jgi:hypothetical protein
MVFLSVTPVPPAGHPLRNATCRGEARSAPAAAIDSEQHRPSDRDLSAQGRRPAGAQHSDGIPGAGADNCAAVAAYRLSVQAGNPLSERKLAQMFGRTSAAGRVPGSPKHGNHRKHPTR